ncbi:MAG: hypothetical protein ACYC0Z_16850 [Acidobacteriaceae bacterium]
MNINITTVVNRIVKIRVTENDGYEKIAIKAGEEYLKVCHELAINNADKAQIIKIQEGIRSAVTSEKVQSTLNSDAARIPVLVASFQCEAFSCESKSPQIRYNAFNKYKTEVIDKAANDKKINELTGKIEAQNAELIALEHESAEAGDDVAKLELALKAAKIKKAQAAQAAQLAIAKAKGEEQPKGAKAPKDTISAYVSGKLSGNVSQQLTEARAFVACLGARLAEVQDDNNAANVSAILSALGAAMYNSDWDVVQAIADGMKMPVSVTRAA